MAFGFTPKFELDSTLNDLTPQQYIVIALEAAKQLDWDITYTSRTGFLAIKRSMWSQSYELKITVDEIYAHIISASLGQGMYDWGKNKSNINELISEIEIIKSELTPEQLNAKAVALHDIFHSQEEDQLTLPPATAADNAKSFISLFVPRIGYTITPIIVDINILIFILMVVSGANILIPDNQVLLRWGANLRPLVLEGQWWRLFTCVFIHAGILHLVLNMYALIYIGLLLEPYLGKFKFAIAYLITGVLASVTSIYWHAFTVSIGASGAIFGMYGIFLSMLTTNFIDKKIRGPLLSSIGVFVLLNLMNGAKAGIDNAAHIGGLISGVIIGYAFYPSLIKPQLAILKYIVSTALVVGAIIACFAVCKNIPDDLGKYQAYMRDFETNEAIALKVYQLPKTTSNSEIISEITNNGIPHWRTELNILNNVDKLNLPENIVSRNGVLRQYCNLRIKSYQFLAREISENKLDKDSAAFYNNGIESLIDTLKK